MREDVGEPQAENRAHGSTGGAGGGQRLGVSVGPLAFDTRLRRMILALRKFTSSELLGAGFSVSAVARRQGLGPQVLVKHNGTRRR